MSNFFCLIMLHSFKCTWAEGSSALLWSRVVLRPSSVRPSVIVNFSHFRPHHCNRWMEFIETWLEARSQRPQPICVFRVVRKKKMASDWLRHFRLLHWNHWREFNETWLEARSQHHLPSLFLFWPRKKNKMTAPASDWLTHFRLVL